MKKLLGFVLFFAVFTAYGQSPARYLIKTGKFFDSEKKQFLSNQYILIEGSKIVKVGQSANQYKAESQFIDLSNATVIPGLIDSHTHLLFTQKWGSPVESDLIEYSDAERLLRGGGFAQSLLDAGITTVKDLGNSGQYLDVLLRDAIKKGWIKGPRVLISGPIISPLNGQFGKLAYLHKALPAREYCIVRTVEEARAAVQEHIANGVDLIKICATNDNGLVLSPEQMRAIVEVAHKNKLKVTAHATYDEIIRDAVEAGVDGIEHGYKVSDSTLRLMAERGTYLVPTDGSYDSYRAITDSTQTTITDKQIKSYIADADSRLLRAIKAGVKIVYGSDMYLSSSRPRGLESKSTLVSYFDAGLPVADVLQIGTYNGASSVEKQQELGVIKEGALADIVAFDGDLEKDFKKLLYTGVCFVMKDGVIHKYERK